MIYYSKNIHLCTLELICNSFILLKKMLVGGSTSTCTEQGLWHLADWFAEAVRLQLSNELENPV